MNNDSKAEREGRELERASIVKWLRARAASWRDFPADANAYGKGVRTASTIADSIEGLAAAIERGSHRS